PADALNAEKLGKDHLKSLFHFTERRLEGGLAVVDEWLLPRQTEVIDVAIGQIPTEIAGTKQPVGFFFREGIDEKIRRGERVIVDVSGRQVRAPHIKLADFTDTRQLATG